MDCLRAQQLISDAVDRVPSDAEELAAAKIHCRECADCAAFVRSLLAVERTGLPQPPPGLAERVIARVRAEAASATGSTDISPTAIPAVAVGQEKEPVRSWQDLVHRARDPRNRRAVATWAAAAAVILVMAGIGAVTGVRTILIPPQAAELGDTSKGTEITSMDSAAPGASSTAAESEEQREEASGQSAPAPDFITVDATVYQLTGPAASVDVDELSEVGSTRTSLNGDGSDRAYDVLGSGAEAIVYVEVEDQLLAFQRVQRSFEGRLYVLQSSPIESFGTWPTLPAGFDAPSSDDGSPTFEEAGTDEAGVTVYHKPGTPVESGIAIGPNPPSPDPLAGAPGWTWWVASP
jgi:hypothetical protein